MRRKLAVIGVALGMVAVAVAMAAVPNGATEAASAQNTTFIVPASDGYGIGDCVSSGSSCGRVVADAWCEAQGFARSQSFGMVDPAEVTGSVSTHVAASRPISITCAK